MIAIPADEEMTFIKYFDEHLDINDIFNRIQDVDYLRVRGYLAHITLLHIIIKEKEHFYYMNSIDNVWKKYREFKDRYNTYDKLMKKINN